VAHCSFMTFVLVHGGGFAASCWDRLAPLLPEPCIAVDLPGRGIHPADLSKIGIGDFVDAVVDEIESRDLHDVVLVGHSLAGVTLPGVVGRVPGRLRRVVFVSCTVPPHSSSVFDTLDPEVQALARETGPQPSGVLDAAIATAIFCNDMDGALTAYTLGLMVPEAGRVIYEPVDLSGLAAGVGRTFVRLSRDAIVTPDKQDLMIANMGGADVVELDAGHMAMISRPHELARVLTS